LAGEARVIGCVDNYVIMRISWVYGKYGKNFVKTILQYGREQLQKRPTGDSYTPLNVVDDQQGNPTWTMEIARQTKVILEDGLFGLFHVTSEGEASWYGFTRDIFDLMKMPVEIHPCTSDQYPRLAPRPRYSVLENQRLKEAGLSVMRPYRDALAEFLALNGEKL
jgi:dTDP-4-dehydrorhamnose reductase